MVLAALAMQLVIGGGVGHAAGEVPAWAIPEPLAAPVAGLRAEAPAASDNPACRAEFCQPRVAIPGREIRFDSRGKRTEMALTAIDGLGLGLISSVARAANAAGVRVDYLPQQLDTSNTSRGGFGKVTAGVRWRLDAWNGPMWVGAAR
jgi:hypothetical protein